MYKFNYQKVSSIKEAEKLLNEDEEAKIIAGGQTLIPTMKQRLASPSVLIDIGGISDLNFIKEENDLIEIGANTTHFEVASSDLIKNKIPSLSDLAEGMVEILRSSPSSSDAKIEKSSTLFTVPILMLSLKI